MATIGATIQINRPVSSTKIFCVNGARCVEAAGGKNDSVIEISRPTCKKLNSNTCHHDPRASDEATVDNNAERDIRKNKTMKTTTKVEIRKAKN